MAANFEIKFDIDRKGGLYNIRLTDTSDFIDPNIKGNFKVQYPDGFIQQNNDFDNADITTQLGTVNYPLRRDTLDQVLNGAYVFTYIVLGDATQDTKEFQFNLDWVEPVHEIESLTEVARPVVGFQNVTPYQVGSYNHVIDLEEIKSFFPTTSALNGTQLTDPNTLDMFVVADEYYEGLYSVNSEYDIAYTHATLAYLTVQLHVTQNEVFDVRKVPTFNEFVAAINAFKDNVDTYKETNTHEFQYLGVRYQYIMSLFEHLLERTAAGLLEGSDGIVQELIDLLFVPDDNYSYQSTPITGFRLIIQGDGTFEEVINFPDIATRDANSGGIPENQTVSVTDASGDPEIDFGAAIYQKVGAGFKIYNEGFFKHLLYDGVDAEAVILAKDPSLFLNQTWWAIDTKVDYRAITSAISGDVWQRYSPPVLVLGREAWQMPQTADMHSLDLGQETYVVATNIDAGSATILNPAVFAVVGVDAIDPKLKEVIKVKAGDLKQGSIYGINTTNAQTGTITKITTFGSVGDVDTSAFVVGDVLYVDEVIEGGLTTTKPSLNAFVVGVVIKVNALDGVIEVNSSKALNEDPILIPGQTNLFWLTGDETFGGDPAGDGNFFLLKGNDAGTVASDTQVIAVNDNEIIPYPKDWLTFQQVSQGAFFQGEGAARVTFEISASQANQKFYMEIYHAQADGTVIDVANALPVGDLGVRPAATLESPIIDPPSTTQQEVDLVGLVSVEITLAIGERLRIHVLSEKVGTAGASQNHTLYFGSDHNTFVARTELVTLDQLQDVTITTPVDRQHFIYDDQTNQWRNLTKTFMNWKGAWLATAYEKNDTVLDGSWTMIANKDTTDRAAPAPIGDAFSLYDGSAPETNATANQVVWGNRYTFTKGGYLTSWRINTVIGNRYEAFLVVDPLGAAIIDPLITFTASKAGWQPLSIDTIAIKNNTVFDIRVIETEPDPSPATFNDDWEYLTPNNSGTNPGIGEITHSGQVPGIMKVHKTSNNLNPQGTNLDTLVVGSIIRALGFSWSIQNIIDAGVHFTFSISPASQATPDGVANFVFETPVDVTLTYVEDVAYWPGSAYAAQVEGLLTTTGGLEDVATNTNAYGADIELQEASVSDDWDVVSSQGGSGGGGSGGNVIAGAHNPGEVTVWGADPNTVEGNPGLTFSGDLATFTGDVNLVNTSIINITGLRTGAGTNANSLRIRGETDAGIIGQLAIKSDGATNKGAVLIQTDDGNGTLLDVVEFDSSQNATFSGQIIANNTGTPHIVNRNIASDGNFILFQHEGVAQARIEIDGGDLAFRADTGKRLIFKTNSNNVALTLGTSQNATFSGDVAIADNGFNAYTLDRTQSLNNAAVGDFSWKVLGNEIARIRSVSVGATDDSGKIVFSVYNGGVLNADVLTLAETGNATFTEDVTADNFILSSDIRNKRNVQSIGGDFIAYNMKGSNQKRVGVSAQALEKTHPEFVRTDEKGMKSVAYIDFLCMKIVELEGKINKYEA